MSAGGREAGGRATDGRAAGDEATGRRATGDEAPDRRATGDEASGGEASGGETTDGETTDGEATDGATTGGATTGGEATYRDLGHVRQMWEDDRASAGLGMELVTLERDHAVVRMPVTETMVNGHGMTHGGFVFTLADSTFALVCNSGGDLTVAAGADISFVAATRVGDVLVAEGVTRASYGRSGITDVRVTREADGALVAEFRGRSRQLARRL